MLTQLLPGFCPLHQLAQIARLQTKLERGGGLLAFALIIITLLLDTTIMITTIIVFVVIIKIGIEVRDFLPPCSFSLVLLRKQKNEKRSLLSLSFVVSLHLIGDLVQQVLMRLDA